MADTSDSTQLVAGSGTATGKSKSKGPSKSRPPRSSSKPEEVKFELGKFPIVFKVTAEPPPEPTTVQADIHRPIRSVAESVSKNLQATTQGPAYDYFAFGRVVAVTCVAVAAKLSAIAKDCQRVAPSYQKEAHTMVGMAVPPIIAQVADSFSEVKFGSNWFIPRRADSYATGLLAVAASVADEQNDAVVEDTLREVLLEVPRCRGVIVSRTTRLEDAQSYYGEEKKGDDVVFTKPFVYFVKHWSYIRSCLSLLPVSLGGRQIFLPEDVLDTVKPTQADWISYWQATSQFWAPYGFGNVQSFVARIGIMANAPVLLRIRQSLNIDHLDGEVLLGEAYRKLREWSPNLKRSSRSVVHLQLQQSSGRRAWLVKATEEGNVINVSAPFEATAEEVSLAAFMRCSPPQKPSGEPFRLLVPMTYPRLLSAIELEVYDPG